MKRRLVSARCLKLTAKRYGSQAVQSAEGKERLAKAVKDGQSVEDVTQRMQVTLKPLPTTVSPPSATDTAEIC